VVTIGVAWAGLSMLILPRTGQNPTVPDHRPVTVDEASLSTLVLRGHPFYSLSLVILNNIPTACLAQTCA
jgi:hypothetical protein